MSIDPEPEESPSVSHEQLRLALKTAASALKESGIAFALAGGYALWVHGAPEPDHDVDIVITEDDVESAADCLRQAGFEIERPPEDWLFKARSNGAMVDVLHRLNATPVDAELIGDAEPQEVLGLHIPVLRPGRVMTSRLLAMTERYCDFGGLLPAVRAVREQVDWTEIESLTRDNDFAAAFLFLARRLGIVDAVDGNG
jgi:hypothetical protein